MRIGVAADHGGFELKEQLAGTLRAAGYEVVDFGARELTADDDMNRLCLGGRVVGYALAWVLVHTFLGARFSGAERHCRRLAKLAALEARRPDDSKAKACKT